MTTPSVSGRRALALLAFISTPGFLAFAALLCGGGLAIAGVHILAGFGWAMIAAAVPLLAAGAVLLRGVIYGG